MSRRSPSPEGVGDLLKQDSFGAFEDEEPMDQQTGEDVMEQDDEEFDVRLDEQENGDEMKDSAPLSSNADKVSKLQSGGRQPIPHFPPSLEKGAGPLNARYFIIKSNNHSNIDQSVKYGIWATQKHNEDKFVEAYKSGASVYFIFSVNMSGHFQGYAKMIGLPFKHKQGLWGGGAAVSNSFDVEWIQQHNLAFRDLEHIRNPLNEDKPIKISRDGQELPPHLGQQVCSLFQTACQTNGTPPPPKADRTHNFNVGPAVGGASFFKGGTGRGAISGPRPPSGPPPNSNHNMQSGNNGLPMGMTMTPMGPLPTQMAMGMGFGMPGAMMPGMDFNPMMGMSHPMMGMGMDVAAMQAMMSGRMPGMMNMPGAPSAAPRNGPVPPPRPPPRSPPRENDMEQLMKNALKTMRNNPGGERIREQDLIMRALEMSRRGSSPQRDRRRYRSRSRSPSPRRYRSHRRSRSRSRSPRSGGRQRDRMTDMSYEEYMDAYNALSRARKEKDSSLDFAGGMSSSNPMMAQMASLMGMNNSKPQRSTSAMGGTSTASNAGVGNMTEDEYVQLWENSSKGRGAPFDENTVRGWYRHYKQTTLRK